MPSLIQFSKHLIPQLLLMSCAIILGSHYHHDIGLWFDSMSWFPYGCLSIAMAIAIKFGRSRMALCCMLFLMLLGYFEYGHQIVPTLTLDVLLLPSAVTIFVLFWLKDTGLSLTNLLITLGYVILGCSAVAYLVYWAESTQLLSALYPFMFNIAPWVTEVFSPPLLASYCFLLIFTLLRLWFRPDSNHSIMFFAMLMVVMLQVRGNVTLLQLVLVIFSGLSIISVLLDSHRMAFKDELTGIASRRALMQYVQTLGRNYVVVMSDIDHFKSFNDTYGHDVGDQVLKLVANKLNKVTGGGKAFRFGGEEFVLIFSRKTIEQVMPHVENLRQQIHDYSMKLRDKDRPESAPKKAKVNKNTTSNANPSVSVTCSFGIACRNKQHKSFEAIMKQADIALYKAKSAGRNCVQV